MRGIGNFLYEYLAVVNDGKQQSLNQARPERGAQFFAARALRLIDCADARICLRASPIARRCACAGYAAKEIFAFSKIFVHNLLTSAYIGV